MRNLIDGYSKQLAVMGKPHFDDEGNFVFEMKIDESLSAMESLCNPVEIIELIRAYGVRDIADMQNKPIWVQKGKDQCGYIIRYLKPWKL